MGDEHSRMTLSVAQVVAMNEALTGASPSVSDAAARIGRGEVVPDEDAEAVVNALSEAMLSNEGFDGQGLTTRGIEIDDIIGVVQQMSEHFYG